MRFLLAAALAIPALFAQENIGPIRIHAGLTSFTDLSGQIWAPDTTYAQGITAISTAPLSPVANAMNPTLYQAQREALSFGSSCSPFSYLFTLPNNRYRLTLKLAELSTTSRTFTATLNGASPAQTIKTEVGQATDFVYYLNVTTGSLSIVLSSVNPVNCAVVSAIEILPQVPITETDVTELNQDLSTTVRQGPGFAAGAVAVINSNGMLDGAVGGPGSCVLIDGTTQSCAYSDGEIPQGTVDGNNITFTLYGSPNPPASLVLTRNGLVLTQGPDYTLSGSTITFATGATPQIEDLLQAFYRM